MERSEIEKDMLQITCEDLAIPPTSVTLKSNFNDDLGADSLDEIELVMATEEHFDIEIEDAEARECNTVKDAVDLVERLLGE